ncbi:protein of unknown function [Roseovarius nanhaiticus]|uniref:DUF4112 domain-containing protein n=1 Tax=Roseovarius nanhaiticus TaxID=573024 RepID=A0A1N7EQ38_9RHOB|nr:protein of unknown function [Roseovarius nanhaiticus]SIR90223.1 protein of unknown function [Roseovarius nanhaiticus]
MPYISSDQGDRAVRRPDELAGDTSPQSADPNRPQTAVLRDLERIDTVARLMDAQFRLPLVGTRIGLDGLIGLVPGIGDVAVMLPPLWMIQRGWQHGARRRTLVRMTMNSGIDLVIGAIPLVGDLFDIGYKANLRNATLLRGDLTRASSAD